MSCQLDLLRSSGHAARLRRAAAAERNDIERQRSRLHEARQEVLAKLAMVDEALGLLEEREMLLARLAPVMPEAARESRTTGARQADALAVGTLPASDGSKTSILAGTGGEKASADLGAGATQSDQVLEILRGPAIRETAVSLLVARANVDTMHYRGWFDMLVSAGYAVAGKDPLAVFLTQLSRSPVVRKTTQSGVYELDRDTPSRLRRDLVRLHAELGQVTAGVPVTADLGSIRARREKIMTAIRQTERSVEEAERVLCTRGDDHHGSDAVAAGIG